METISGTIESMSQAYKNGWRILTISSGDKLTGCIPGGVKPGDRCSFNGSWQTHPKFGKQFKVDDLKVEMPKDETGVENYLKTHLKWVGEKRCAEMSRMFGSQIFDILKNDPIQLTKIKGITAARAQEISDAYRDIEGSRDIDVFFSAHGITLNMRARLVEAYASVNEAYKQVKANPYNLSKEVFGVGFIKADTIALSMGIERNSPMRIEAGIEHVLTVIEGDGHCYFPERHFLKIAIEQLAIDGSEFFPYFTAMCNDERIVKQGGRIYRKEMYEKEISVARNLAGLLDSRSRTNLTTMDIDTSSLDEDQRKAIGNIRDYRLQIITGNPGVGKTFMIKKLVEAFGPDSEIKLAAPTGKAAKRMEEATGMPASTIHRLLEYNPYDGGFSRNKGNPLDCDVLIIDECSMIDIHLMASLLDAMPSDGRLILVGDKDQLPSVGPGAVLRDMISSERIPTVYLRTLHRQAAESLIIANAHKINKGEMIALNKTAKDFIFIEEENVERIPDIIKEVGEGLVKEFGAGNVQVLCPMKKSAVGVINMNKIMRPVFNEGFETMRKVSGTIFHVWDKIIQTRNNYALNVFNGDIGVIIDFDGGDKFTIDFGGMIIEYPVSNSDDVHLAYALTIHKFQGSQMDAVIIPMHTANYIMLKRNLLYTAITRGKKRVVVVGSRKAVKRAIATPDSHKRFTSLHELLASLPGPKE